MDQELILELPNDIRSIEHAVVYVMRHCSTCCDYARRFNLNFRVGLTEALSNAMLYGNNRDPNKRVRIEVTVRVEEIAVRVTDNNYENNASGSLIWQGDSMQIAFDVADNNGTPYDTTDDFEYGWARAAGDAPASFRWFTPSGHPAYVAAPYSVVRTGTTTVYEVSFTPGDLGLSSFSAATGDIGFSWMVNEADGSGREGFLEWTSGIGFGKSPALFGTLRFHPDGP